MHIAKLSRRANKAHKDTKPLQEMILAIKIVISEKKEEYNRNPVVIATVKFALLFMIVIAIAA